MDSPPDGILLAYVDAAIEHGRATSGGDYRAANRAHDVVARLYARLRRQGTSAQALSPLLHHPEASVRIWAASHALEFAPSLGVPVLATAAADPGMAGFTAAMVLSEWRAGRLSFPDV